MASSDIPPLNGDLDPTADLTRSQGLACVACNRPIADTDRYCRACGTPVGRTESDGHRFRPGALFAARFRMIAPLGHGGMGEVYHAYDIDLDQPVALKFLRAGTRERSADLRRRLRTEVRLARQISHPNVCRVYDIGEADGVLYVSMEFVDGEDLAALLKRIGRFPVDKGVEIARRLCSGLAAAHARGVLHRDLKPSNIMIDGTGNVRIMDFGLAVTADSIGGADARSGTPGYMAPEQLAGGAPSISSDLYALGLVLYELFTGRRPFDASTADQLLYLRESPSVPDASSLVPELSPAIGKAIRRCLEAEPRLRPRSALTLAATFGGGDPVTEALAAGETPSPEAIAASGAIEGVRPRVALGLFGCVVLGLAGVLILTPGVQVVSQLPLGDPPIVLAARARDIAHKVHFGLAVRDVASGFRYDDGHVRHLQRMLDADHAASAQAWRGALSAAPYPLVFWHTRSEQPLIAAFRPFAVGKVPPPAGSSAAGDSVGLELDLDGRLLNLRGHSRTMAPSDGKAADWRLLFEAAGLEMTRFTSVEPRASPTGDGAHFSWTGSYPGRQPIPVRVEAASFSDGSIDFRILFPWSDSTEPKAGDPTEPLWAQLILLVVLAAIAVVARANVRDRRADTNGAWRMAGYTSIGYAMYFLLGGHKTNLVDWMWSALAIALALGAYVAISYLALEPWVRRLWPHSMTTWSRVLKGRWRDPLVSRDILIAVAAAALGYAVQQLAALAAIHLGAAPSGPRRVDGPPFGFVLNNLMGNRFVMAEVLGPFLHSLDILMFLFVAVVIQAKLRPRWLAAFVYLAFWEVVLVHPSFLAADWVMVIRWTFDLILFFVLMVHFGIFAAVAAGTASLLMSSGVLTWQLTAWYGQSSLVVAAVLTGIAMAACWYSLGERPFFRPRQGH